MPKLKIDGIEIEVEQGTSILQAAEQLGIEIPRFCYHDRLSVPTNCRMCLVEVTPGPPKPQASCALACGQGMEVKTNSDVVKKARKGALEMQLINHPLDCPVCDQGGECDLQDQAYAFGFDRSRYYEHKSAMKDKALGPLIKTVMTRCINCTRCIRFSEEIAGTPVLGQFNRGEDTEIGTFIEQVVETELSGNLIDVCPVGALTSKPYAFHARPWELQKTETIDVHDAVGCNIRVDARGREVMRILPRLHEDVNEEWINDRSRFACDGLKENRLDRPWVRDENGKLQESSWEDALTFVAKKLKNGKKDKVGALVGDLCDLESMVALKDLMGGMGFTNLECRTDGAAFDPKERCGYLFNTGIAGIEEADAILLVGTNPRWEASMVNARIRKTWLKKGIKIGLIGENVDLTYPYEPLGAGPQDLSALMSARGGFATILRNAKNPMIIVGMGAFQRHDGLAVHGLAHEVAEHFKMVKRGWNGFNILHNASSRVGALDIGFYSKAGFDPRDMSLLYVLGADNFDVSALTRRTFVIYQGHHGDATAARADIILPGAAYTEKDGLYVNMEGRVQQALHAVSPPGDAKADWKILRGLSGYMGKPLPYDTILQLRDRITKEWPHLGELDVLPSISWNKFGKKTKLLNDNFKAVFEDFYQTNVICRASKTMQEATEAFIEHKEQKKHMEAAE